MGNNENSNSTYAEMPGNLALSERKLKELRPDLYSFSSKLMEFISTQLGDYTEISEVREQLLKGDSQPAIISSIEPLVVAVYTDELDCVIQIHFHRRYVKKYNLEIGKRLLAVNRYQLGDYYQEDIELGRYNLGNWTGCFPLIADFLSDDIEEIERKKQFISEEAWERLQLLSKEYRDKYPNRYRDGKVFRRLQFASK